MKTIIKTGILKILTLFYVRGNSLLHLREIARKTKMNESGVSRYLNILINEKILVSEKEGNMKKFQLNRKAIPEIFPIFDSEEFNKLPLLRRNALKFYINNLEKKPIFSIVFGSTAKGTYKNDSDLDILEVVNSLQNNENAKRYAELQTGIKIQVIQITLSKFKEELKMKKDQVIQSALETGLPFFNNKYYYEIIYE